MASTEAYSEAYLQENRGWIMILVTAVSLALALVFMGLRLYTRLRLLPGTQGLEDWLLTSACVGLVILVATFVLEVEYGAGRHFVTISPESLTLYFKDFYFSSLCYQCTLYLVKCTLIVQYLRIFGMSRGTRIACWVTLVFLTLFSGGLVVAGIFACWPIYAFWDVTYPDRAGACVDLTNVWYAHSGLSISTDFVILAIPLPVTRALRLSAAEKTATLVLFGFGSFGVLASIIRLYEQYELSHTTDFTWDAVRSVWSVVEVAVFIVCACVTGLKPFFDRKFVPLVARVLPASCCGAAYRAKAGSRSTTMPKSSVANNNSPPAGAATPQPWMRSMTRRVLGRRGRPAGTGMGGFFGGATITTRGADMGCGESAVGITAPGAAEHGAFEMGGYNGTKGDGITADDNEVRSHSRGGSFHSFDRPEAPGDHDNKSLTPSTTKKSERSSQHGRFHTLSQPGS